MTTRKDSEDHLNLSSERGIPDAMSAHHDRERTRLSIVLSLLGVGEASEEEAAIKLDRAISLHPEGHLVMTHGPVDEPEENPHCTFENLLALSWQDDDYGSQFNELLWSRP